MATTTTTKAESLTEVRRKGDVLAFAVDQLLELAPTPPCRTCSIEPSGRCALHRRLEAVAAAVADWKRK